MNRKLMGTLAKVIAAAGWADNQLTSAEIENLKDLLFLFQGSVIDPREDALFQMYIKSPVGATERERLVQELREITYLADYFLIGLDRVNKAFLKVTSSSSSL